MRGSLDQLAGRLLLQCRASQAERVAPVAAAHDAGIVVTGRHQDALTAAAALRSRGFDGPVLCDADRYSGGNRKPAAQGIQPEWCRRQRERGLIALTDSGYLAAGDDNGLDRVLREAATQPAPTIAMLPLAAEWFASSGRHRTLTNKIESHGVPVAVAIEHDKDPFAAQYVLRGFLELLAAATVPVLLLRSDVSALGALCHGAHAAAIGVTSTLRHLYRTPSGGGGRPAGVSAFISGLLSYHLLATCARAFAHTPELDHLWRCDCPVCGGALPARLEATADPYTAATFHSLHAQLELHTELRPHRHTREQRISAWHESCSHALFLHEQVADLLPAWRAPANLRSWLRVTEDPLAARRYVPEPAGERPPRAGRPGSPSAGDGTPSPRRAGDPGPGSGPERA
ncbi:hypothetical protein FB384_003585 [Prauserella sediminis]|uniref:Uncharacterized protein n=1 Tax=Prauserella sediminis TaxID=577680 RepID=A0A839XPK9_9PSEU|nr:hypothetical protein [Prauserella sediminis]MBB3664681.1 hypothetical protein [Prauserella sediminis]